MREGEQKDNVHMERPGDVFMKLLWDLDLDLAPMKLGLVFLG